jgi:predicted MFS family arabinose efflux permease
VLSGFATGNESGMLSSALPLIAAETGVTVGQAGYLALGYALAYAVATPLLAGLLGSIDRRRVLVFGQLTFAFGCLLIVLAPDLPMLIAARVVLAIGAGLSTATTAATAVAISPIERRGSAIAVATSGQSLAVLIGVPLGTVLIAYTGWRIAYVGFALIALGAAVGTLWKLPRDIAGDRIALRDRLGIVRLPGIPAALGVTLLSTLAAFGTAVFIAPLAEGAGFAREHLPYVLFASGVGGVTGMQLGGRMADRLGPGRAVRVVTIGLAIALVGLAMCLVLPHGIGTALFIPVLVVTSAVSWAFLPSQASRLAGLASGAPALALGLNLTAMNIGVALSAWIGGLVVDNASIFWLPLVGVPFAIAACGLTILGGREVVAPALANRQG